MKNLLFLFLGVFTLLSCSNTEENPQEFNRAGVQKSNTNEAGENIDPVLKELYITMIQSQSYIDFEQEVIKFNEKLGVDIPESEMSSESSILNWISGNISRTTFIDYNEASTQSKKIISLAGISNAKNGNFFEYLAGTQPGTLAPILNEITPEPLGCKACKASFKNCMAFANSEYTTAIQNASLTFTKDLNSDTHNDAITAAINKLTHRREGCGNAFEKCCSGGY